MSSRIGVMHSKVHRLRLTSWPLEKQSNFIWTSPKGFAFCFRRKTYSLPIVWRHKEMLRALGSVSDFPNSCNTYPQCIAWCGSIQSSLEKWHISKQSGSTHIQEKERREGRNDGRKKKTGKPIAPDSRFIEIGSSLKPPVHESKHQRNPNSLEIQVAPQSLAFHYPLLSRQEE